MQSLFVHVLEHVHCRLTESAFFVKEAEALRGQNGGHLQGQEEAILLEMFALRIKHYPCRILGEHCADQGSPLGDLGLLGTFSWIWVPRYPGEFLSCIHYLCMYMNI